MAIADLTKKIIEEAQLEVREVEAAASKTSEESLRTRVEAAQKEQSQRLEKGRKAAENRQDQARVTGEIRKRQAVLAQKRQSMGSVFEDLLKELLTLNDTEYAQVIESLVKKAFTSLGCTKATITFPQEDKGRVSKAFQENLISMIHELQPKGQAQKAQISILFDEILDGKGGMVVSTESLRIENTFTTLIENARPFLESKLAELLFEEE